MIKAALALHAATLDRAYLAEAEALRRRRSARHHWDADAPGYFLSADDAEALIIRPRRRPTKRRRAPTSLMAPNLVRLWRLTGDDDYRARRRRHPRRLRAAIAGNLFAADRPAQRLDLRLGAVDVVIVAAGRGRRRAARRVRRAGRRTSSSRSTPTRRISRRPSRRRQDGVDGRRPPMSAAARPARCR